jgi:hypothetical protein
MTSQNPEQILQAAPGKNTDGAMFRANPGKPKADFVKLTQEISNPAGEML